MVFDVTFFDSHPQPWDMFLEYAGKDATKDFMNKCNPKVAEEFFDTYQVGWVDTDV